MLLVQKRISKKVKARVISDREQETLHGFIAENVETGTLVYTDDFKAYRQLTNYSHQFVKHGAGEYVNEMAHTNGLESFWAMLKRAHKGTYHKMSVKHLGRYVNEFSGRHNIRELDTIDQMNHIVKNLEGKRLEYKELVSRIDLAS